MARQKRKIEHSRNTPTAAAAVPPRIIGGLLRGRRLAYSGDPRTRPMKDRVREAVFNLLGTDVQGKHVLDLFAGTGALGLEAISRGAIRATLIERHFPTAALVRQSAAELAIDDRCTVESADTFIWFRRGPALGDLPWLVFCSPPFDFYIDRAADMLELLGGILTAAPHGSVMVVEADARFDFSLLPSPDAWRIRPYPPAVVGILEKAKG
jgi:16S rRNA (guanine(966)-N(2))-methyltransferase RsmD